MAVVVSPQLEFHLTGGINGATNTNPYLSLGGVMATVLKDNRMDNLWDPISTQEQSEGWIEYRWIVLFNNRQEPLKNPHFYFIPKDPYVDIEFSRLAVSYPVTILAHEDDRPPEEEIGPEVDVPMPFTKSTEDFETTQSVSPDIPAMGKLYICVRRAIPDEAPSENKAYVIVVESRVPQVTAAEELS
jgi:hypothetical protein